MQHIANTFHDIMIYIDDRCGMQPPVRHEEEIKDFLRANHERWDYGEDMDSLESGLRQVLDEMFESRWIWGEAA